MAKVKYVKYKNNLKQLLRNEEKFIMKSNVQLRRMMSEAHKN